MSRMTTWSSRRWYNISPSKLTRPWRRARINMPTSWQTGQPTKSVSQSVNQASNQTHIHTQPFNGLLSGTNRVGWYQKKQSHPSWSSDIPYRLPPLLQSVVSSLFSLHAWQSLSTTSLQVLFGLPLGLGPSTSYSMHFFNQSSIHHLLFAAHCHTIAAHGHTKQAIDL